MGINNQQALLKVMKALQQQGLFTATGNNTYTVAGTEGSPYAVSLVYNNQFAILSNSTDYANAFMTGGFKKEKMPALFSDNMNGHPLAVVVDAKEMFNGINTSNGASATTTTYNAAKNLIESFYINGGNFKDDAFTYHLKVNFINKQENSLLQIFNYTQIH